MNATQIHELRVRAPGLTQEQGRRLGEAVARRLLNVQLDRPRTIPALAVRVRAASASIDRLADDIVRGIRRKIL